MTAVENGMLVDAERYDVQAREPKAYACPVCGAELHGCDTFVWALGEIVGCEKCASQVEVWEVYEN